MFQCVFNVSHGDPQVHLKLPCINSLKASCFFVFIRCFQKVYVLSCEGDIVAEYGLVSCLLNES